MRAVVLKQAWRHASYASASGIHDPATLLRVLDMERGDSLYDFGCGDGSMVDWFNRYGIITTGFDLVQIHEETIPHDLVNREIRLGMRDYGICLGVMDHISESDVPQVLRNMREIVVEDIYFTIPIRDLGYNDLLGKKVQQTLKPIGWWRNRLTEIGLVKIGQTGDWMTAHVKRA